jgi:fructoselysine-6-P-deglycase FrlB-like protein
MRADMARQPAVLRALAARATEFREAGAALAPSSGEPGRIFVTGCGDGYFAACAIADRARALGVDWRPLGALDCVLTADRMTAGDRLVAISMSGNVDRTVEAARTAADRGIRVLALVNGNGGRLADVAQRKLSLDLADIAPFLCGTASYTATLAALSLIAEGARGGASDTLPFERLAAAQEAALARADAAIPAVASPVPSGVRLLSAGIGRATADYGAAKLVELTRIPCWAGDLEEFAHSQYWSMPSADLVVAIAAEPALARYASETCAALAALGTRTLAIDTTATPVSNATARVTLPELPPSLAPIVAALPLQALAHALALATGLDPDRRSHLKADETRFRVSRLLTRRSLVGTGQ